MTGRTQKALTHAAVLSGSGPPPLLAASLLLTRQLRGAAGKWVLALPSRPRPTSRLTIGSPETLQGAGLARAWDALRTWTGPARAGAG